MWADTEEYIVNTAFTPTKDQKVETTNVTFVFNNSGWSATDAAKGCKGSNLATVL